MNKEKVRVDWLNIWIVSSIVVILVTIIPFSLFEAEIGEIIIPIKPEYLTVFGFWLFIIDSIWIAFSAWCIYQVGKYNTKGGN